jgi:serine/threonine-protein kinase
MTCPDENAIAHFVQGLLAPEQGQALTRHVDSCSRCHLLLGELARAQSQVAISHVSQVRGAAIAGPYRAGPPLVGERIGRYQVEAQLGSGGMGVVYLARDPMLQRRVALKLVRADLLGRQGEDRLLREARALAAISHPRVVSVFDADRYDGGIFLAMELIDGHTLADWCRAAQRPWREVVDRFIEAGDGLQAAHEAGILHRDFKPQNVMIARDGRARVTDFGLARTADEASSSRVPLTEHGAVVGTPAYMAPEQLLAGVVDARSDQYSFCVALYEALFGVRPFPVATPAELFADMSSRQFRPPDDGRGVPQVIVEVLRRGLAFSREHRFGSMRELVAALRTAGDSTGLLHLRIHTACQAVFTLGHWGFLAYTAKGTSKEVSSPRAAPSTTASAAPSPTASNKGSGGSDLTVSEGAIAAFALLFVFGWLLGGVLWAPLNAFGLWRRRSWSRRSTLVYGVCAVITVIGIPYAIYSVWSLTRPVVKRTFEDGLD